MRPAAKLLILNAPDPPPGSGPQPGVLVWSPLAFGFLTGRYRSSGTWDSATGRPALRPSNFDPGDATTRAKLAVVDQLLEVATDVGCTLPELAIAFTLSHPAVTSTIIGPRTPPSSPPRSPGRA